MKVGRIKATGDLEIVSQIHEMWPVFDEEKLVDDNRKLDDNYKFDDEEGMEGFISYLFGIPFEWDNVNRVLIDEKGDIIISEFDETADKISIDQKRLKINGELIEGVNL